MNLLQSQQHANPLMLQLLGLNEQQQQNRADELRRNQINALLQPQSSGDPSLAQLVALHHQQTQAGNAARTAELLMASMLQESETGRGSSSATRQQETPQMSDHSSPWSTPQIPVSAEPRTIDVAALPQGGGERPPAADLASLLRGQEASEGGPSRDAAALLQGGGIQNVLHSLQQNSPGPQTTATAAQHHRGQHGADNLHGGTQTLDLLHSQQITNQAALSAIQQLLGDQRAGATAAAQPLAHTSDLAQLIMNNRVPPQRPEGVTGPAAAVQPHTSPGLSQATVSPLGQLESQTQSVRLLPNPREATPNRRRQEDPPSDNAGRNRPPAESKAEQQSPEQAGLLPKGSR